MQYFVAVAAGVNFQWRDALTALASLDEKLKAVAGATDDDGSVSLPAALSLASLLLQYMRQCKCHVHVQCTFNT